MAQEVVELLQKRNPNACVTTDEVVEMSYAINRVAARRIVAGERVQLKGLGNLFLEVNGATTKVIPGVGPRRIPNRYNVDFNPSQEIKNLFAGLPEIDHDFEEEPVVVNNEGIEPVLEPTDLGGTENPLPETEGQPEQVLEPVVEGVDGEETAEEDPFPGYDPEFKEEEFSGKLSEAKKAKKA